MHFKLRPWHESDLDSLVQYANNWNIAKNLTDRFPFPYTASAGKQFIAMATQDEPIHVFAIEVDGQAIGGIGVHPQDDIFRKNMELGYWLAEPFWGQGIITEAIKQILDFAFSTYDIERVFARPFGSNKASQRVLEKAGFRLEATLEKTLFKNGEFLDELIYGYRRKAVL